MGSVVSNSKKTTINDKPMFDLKRETYYSSKQEEKWIRDIDLFIYINLEKRTDRKKNIIEEFKKLGIPSSKIVRFNAVQNKVGFMGCTHSHLKCVQAAISFGCKRICLFEDDFVLVAKPEEFHTCVNRMMDHVCNNFDVIYLAMTPIKLQKIQNLKTEYRVLQALAMPAMIVNRNFLKTLKSIYQSALDEKKEHDLVTQRFQSSQKWYGFYPPIARQRPGLSDIENRDVDYFKLENGQMLTIIEP
jgi:glycosyl transferase family 25